MEAVQNMLWFFRASSLQFELLGFYSSTADGNDSEKGIKGQNRKLSPEDEFLMVMAQLNLWLLGSQHSWCAQEKKKKSHMYVHYSK